MIYRDEDGYLTDQTGDHGDSAHRAGLLALCKSQAFLDYYSLYPKTSLLRRSPVQPPWNNPYNFSKDQLMPLVAGMSVLGYNTYELKALFKSHAKRLFFCQNFERDYSGTTKYPFPHKVDGKWRLFDFADPLLPDDIYLLAKAAKLPVRHLLALIGIPWFILTLLIHRFDKSNDEGQIIAKCSIMGKWALRAYRRFKPNFKEALYQYWAVARNEKEYADLLQKLIEEA